MVGPGEIELWRLTPHFTRSGKVTPLDTKPCPIYEVEAEQVYLLKIYNIPPNFWDVVVGFSKYEGQAKCRIHKKSCPPKVAIRGNFEEDEWQDWKVWQQCWGEVIELQFKFAKSECNMLRKFEIQNYYYPDSFPDTTFYFMVV